MDGRQSGLQAHLNFPLQENWSHITPGTDIVPPFYKKRDFIKMIKKCIERKNVPSINLEVYEDGMASPQLLELMRALRKAIQAK